MSSDISFGIDVNNNPITATKVTYVSQIMEMLFKMNPGDDPIQPKKGIGIGKANYSFPEDLEAMRDDIMTQVSSYTDYIATAVEFVADNRTNRMGIVMRLIADGKEYTSLILPPSDDKSLEVYVKSVEDTY